jgi:hypothetical protein
MAILRATAVVVVAAVAADPTTTFRSDRSRHVCQTA